ncbi:MAG: oxidoreductase [Hamadaea sp.]|nr:oxidoreductase [Hamadaea sp.]NUR52218.1 oxidoreductase [Hamadaea sp.]NUR69980.1 oxidoreductase [Hamadaea sp.]NUT03992.1 oxidoreductase [Hamadaea sp.]
MARAAVSRRLTWRAARLREVRAETDSAHTLVFEVPGWPGHLAGQHVDVRLTAEDGYSTERSYSIASAFSDSDDLVELTVQRIPDGEVSPYLVDVLQPGMQVELRGPVGGWFVWRAAETAPVLLVAGGSGVVPLMAMIRARAEASVRVPFRLVYSTRTPEDVLYAEELRRRALEDRGLDVTVVYTRRAPDGHGRPPGRLTAADLAEWGWPPDFEPAVFVCGPTGFVEAAADLLIDAGHEPQRIKTERFGGTDA